MVVFRLSREDGFTISELLVTSTILMLTMGAALTTFKNGLAVNDTGSQLSDSNQNLRAGTNQLMRDLMQAGRIIGPEGIPVPTGTGVAINRPAPPGIVLTFNLATTTNLPDITTGSGLGPTINGQATDVVTIMTIDPFVPTIETPPIGAIDPNEGTLDPAGATLTLPANSFWLIGDPVNDAPGLLVGDLVLFKNPSGMAIQTVTGKDATHLYFKGGDANDWFNFNQPGAASGSITQIKGTGGTPGCPGCFQQTTLFRAMMITYYVDKPAAPGVPRLTRIVNHFTPQALAGVVEDLEFTYDLVDGVNNPTNVAALPWFDAVNNVTYNSNQIRKVNIHIGVRSEVISKPSQDYVRNHISTAVDVRSLASVDRYVAQ
jgi:hypothetical protein